MWVSRGGKRLGFTLIEIVIVLSIIALMATLIMVGYSRLASSYKLALITDNFASEVQLLRTQATSQQEISCYGMEIKAGESVELLRAEFVDPLRKCGQLEVERKDYPDESLYVDNVRVNTSELQEFVFYYAPPLGELVFPNTLVDQNAVISFDLRLTTAEEGDAKTLYLLPATGKVTDVNPLADE